MLVELFDMERDLPTLKRWCRDWNITAFPDWIYPEENYIIDNIIFASFYKTDSAVCYMENVVGNKECPSDLRAIALGVLGEYIFKRARSLGFKTCIGWTSNKSVAKTSAKHGMILTEYNHAAMYKLL